MLDLIVDYRFLAPAKIAADELCAREMARAARPRALGWLAAGGRPRAAALRVRLGTALVEVGTRLQRSAAPGLDAKPETSSPAR